MYNLTLMFDIYLLHCFHYMTIIFSSDNNNSSSWLMSQKEVTFYWRVSVCDTGTTQTKRIKQWIGQNDTAPNFFFFFFLRGLNERSLVYANCRRSTEIENAFFCPLRRLSFHLSETFFILIDKEKEGKPWMLFLNFSPVTDQKL